MHPNTTSLLVLLAAIASSLFVTTRPSPGVAQDAGTRRCSRPEARGTAPRSLPNGVPIAGFDGRDFFVLGAGGFLARVDACSARWRVMRSPVADVAGAQIVQTALGALVLAPTGVFAIRRGAAARVRGLGGVTTTPVAVAGPEVALLAGDSVAVVDVRTRRVLHSTAAPHPIHPAASAVAVDAERVSVVVPGASAMSFDRRSGAWIELPAPPAATDVHLALVARSIVLLGTIDRARNTLGAFELAPGAAAWESRELPSAGVQGRVVAMSSEGDRLIVSIASGSTRSRVAYAAATGTWSALDGVSVGGREVADGRLIVGAQSPVAPAAGRYAIVSAAAGTERARWAVVPSSLGAFAGTTTNDYGALAFAAGAGRVLAVRAPSETPTGWQDDPSSCTGPREPGAPGCDPVSEPTGVTRTAGESFVFRAP